MTFTIPATSKGIIKIVVWTLAVVAIMTILTLSICVIMGAKPDPTLLTAYVGIATGSLAGITGLLANTRTTPGTDADMPKGTLTPDAPEPPTPVKVISTEQDPVHTEEAPANLAR
jgi:hypothetical protein